MRAISKVAQEGLTLIELIVCVSIASILLGMALPMMQGFVRKQQTIVEVNRLVGALNYTRSEAVLQRRSLRLCAGNASDGCRSDPIWRGDWLILPDALAGRAGEPLQVFLHHSKFVWYWRGAGGKTSIRFKADGSAVGQNGTFTLCEQGEALHQVVINFAGRIRTQNPSGHARCK